MAVSAKSKLGSCRWIKREERIMWNALYVPIATNLNFLGPDVGVKSIAEVLIHDRAVLVVHNAVQSVPNQEAREAKANKDTNDGEDGNPFLFGVNLGKPRLLNLTLAHTPRVEEARAALVETSTQGAGGAEARGRARYLWAGEGVTAHAATTGGSRLDVVAEGVSIGVGSAGAEGSGSIRGSCRGDDGPPEGGLSGHVLVIHDSELMLGKASMEDAQEGQCLRDQDKTRKKRKRRKRKKDKAGVWRMRLVHTKLSCHQDSVHKKRTESSK
jgi:hypothetical protein